MSNSSSSSYSYAEDCNKVNYNTHTPMSILRYKYVAVLTIIVILVILWNTYQTRNTGKNVLFNPEDIDFPGLILYLVVVIIIFCILMKFQGTENGISDNMWDGLHFLFYFFLAFFIPNNWIFIITLQVAWELFEDFMWYRYGKLSFIESDSKKVVDILANSTGYFLGNLVFSNMKLRNKIKTKFHSWLKKE